MPATPAWMGALEAQLNRWIEASTPAYTSLRRLDGTALHLVVGNFAAVRVGIVANRVALTFAVEESADATILGSPGALLQLVRGGANAGQARTGVQIRGDAEIANAYRDLFMAARPDLEEELARVLGDLPARHLTRTAQRAFSWLRNAGRTAGDNMAEYLQEESRDLVNRTELEEFLQGVDGLRESADRVKARVAALEQRLKGSP